MARRVVRGLLLLEAAGLLGALLLYRAMDRSQDFRYTMQKRFPSILEGVVGVSDCWIESSKLEDYTSNKTNQSGSPSDVPNLQLTWLFLLFSVLQIQ